ncbi:MAG: Tail-specific protease [Glaciecola sp. HTCC2999]|jgi:carboxyl-terminal processing protease|nr:MAG: Tail-specific protease [Glaciecola sp. HTCC2999]
MYKRLAQSFSVVTLSLCSLTVTAAISNLTPELEALPVLTQEPQHAKSAKRIVNTYARNHYKKFTLDDNLSGKIFTRFLRNLDFNKNFFLASDIKQFEKYASTFDDFLMIGDLTTAYKIYQTNLERREARLLYAISLLDNEYNFNKADDKFYYDREDAQWAVSISEMNELWRQRVKYDLLNLKLADKTLDEAKAILKKRYQRNIKRLYQTNSEDVFQSLMNAFSRSIEAHTSYLSPRSAERFQMQMNLSFEGIGASLQIEDEHTVVRKIIAGGPADKSGKLKPEDKIVGVGQEKGEIVDVVGWRLDEVVELIKGPKGSIVKLQVLKGDSETKKYELIEFVRDKIKLEDQQAQSEVYVPESTLGDTMPLGVIEIPSFYNGLTSHVRSLISDLKKDNVSGIIIDLRGNGGGSLNESRTLTGLFIDSGPVVQVRNHTGSVQIERDNDGVIHYAGPLTVLVDRYSASASEIFAAAMQDYNRAIVIGEQTFGKGTVQRHKGLGRYYDLNENPLGSIQFTTAKFYRISGSSTQHIGVIPDILYPSAVVPEEWGESQEENALPYDSINRATYTSFSNTQDTIDILTAKHKKRVMQNPEFAYIFADIDEYQSKKDRNYISLVESERLAEQKESQSKRLARTNERLQRKGLAPIKSMEDLPDDVLDIDPLLDEAANITYDLIGTSKFAIK